MRPIAAYVASSVVCVYVCLSVLVKRMCCAKTAETIKMSFEGKEAYDMLYEGQNRTTPFAAVGDDKSAMRLY